MIRNDCYKPLVQKRLLTNYKMLQNTISQAHKLFTIFECAKVTYRKKANTFTYLWVFTIIKQWLIILKVLYLCYSFLSCYKFSFSNGHISHYNQSWHLYFSITDPLKMISKYKSEYYTFSTHLRLKMSDTTDDFQAVFVLKMEVHNQ